MVRFSPYVDNENEATYIGTQQNNGDFLWFPVIRLTYLDAFLPNPHSRYVVNLCAVSPSEAGTDGVQYALDSCGDPRANGDTLETVYCLAHYGISAPIYEQTGNNRKQLMERAKREAQLLCMLFGFYMDRAINQLGADGWHAIKGQLNPYHPEYAKDTDEEEDQ